MLVHSVPRTGKNSAATLVIGCEMDWLTHSVSRSIDIRRIVWATHRMEKTQQLSQLCIIQVIADAFGDDRSRGGGFRGVFSVSVRKHRVFHSRTSPSGVA